MHKATYEETQLLTAGYKICPVSIASHQFACNMQPWTWSL